MKSRLNNFYISSGLFGILSLLAAITNYLLYPALARTLDTTNFGDFAVVSALSNQILGVLLAVNIISIYLVKTREENIARQQVQIIQRSILIFFGISSMAVLIFSPLIQSLLQIRHISSFIVLGAILFVAIPGVIWSGYLQGHKKLVRVGVYNLSSALAKLLCAPLLAFYLGPSGALFGLFISGVIGLAILRLNSKINLPSILSIFTKLGREDKQFLRSVRLYFLECIFVVGSLSFLQNIDITLAKALFDPALAGVYSGVSIMSNALFYLGFILVWIILPEISIKDPSSNQRVLWTAYRLLGLLTVSSVAIIYLLRDYITEALLGKNFAGQGSILLFAALYQLTLVAITLYGYYLLVDRDKRGIFLGLSILSCCLTLPAALADSPIEMIRTLWLSLLLGFAIYWIISKVYEFTKTPAN